MQTYQKARMIVAEETNEGVYMGSGEPRVCRFGRKEANPGADVCQSCSKSNGTSSNEKAYKQDYKGCVDNMPQKK